MSIAKQIIVRYRAKGHARFTVPPELCQAQAAEVLEGELRKSQGVYRVDLYRRQGKLSIRYIEGVTDFKAVSRSLFMILPIIEDLPAEQPSCCSGGLVDNEDSHKETGWLKAKLQEAKETFTALGVVTGSVGTGKPMALSPENEKFAIEFFTDILVLYLIKLHWHMIMGHWIRSPWQYRSEWMATIYMIFLLVRSKKPKK